MSVGRELKAAYLFDSVINFAIRAELCDRVRSDDKKAFGRLLGHFWRFCREMSENLGRF